MIEAIRRGDPRPGQRGGPIARRPEHRGPRRDFDNRGGKSGPHRGGKPGDPRSGDGFRNGGQKFGGPKPGGGAGRPGKPGGWTERPPREKTPDPNSPFAKLLALKAELEAKQGEKG
jgi:ATP-dependent RNA helicase SUPV3L1/SUV3